MSEFSALKVIAHITSGLDSAAAENLLFSRAFGALSLSIYPKASGRAGINDMY